MTDPSGHNGSALAISLVLIDGPALVGDGLAILVGIFLLASDDSDNDNLSSNEEIAEGTSANSEDSFRDNLRDIQDNPENWEETSDPSIEPSEKYKGGNSIEEEFTNKYTGDQIWRHTLTDSSGRASDSHYRPYPKQRR